MQGRNFYCKVIVTAFCTVFLFHSPVFSAPDVEKAYITHFPEALIVKPFISMTSMEFSIEPRETGTVLNYKPNVFANYGVSLAYWIFGVSLSTKFDNNGKDPAVYGSSSYFDFQFNYYGRYLGADLNLAVYEGYYIDNSTAVPEGIALAPEKIRFSGLRTAMIGLNVYYIVDHEKLSLTAAFDHSAKQNRSAGSWLLMISYNQMHIKSPESIIPVSLQSLYGEIGDFNEGGFATLAFLPGYVYSFVWRNFYFTAVIFLGAGFQVQGYNSPTLEQRLDAGATVLKVNLRFSFGYNGERFFSGLSFVDDFSTIANKQSNMNINAQLLSVMLFAGYRF